MKSAINLAISHIPVLGREIVAILHIADYCGPVGFALSLDGTSGPAKKTRRFSVRDELDWVISEMGSVAMVPRPLLNAIFRIEKVLDVRLTEWSSAVLLRFDERELQFS